MRSANGQAHLAELACSTSIAPARAAQTATIGGPEFPVAETAVIVAITLVLVSA